MNSCSETIPLQGRYAIPLQGRYANENQWFILVKRTITSGTLTRTVRDS